MNKPEYVGASISSFRELEAAQVVMDKKPGNDRCLTSRHSGHLLPDLLQNIQRGLPVEYKNHAPHGIYRHADPGGILKVNTLDLKTVFHNPCELGRGCDCGGCPRKCAETSKPEKFRHCLLTGRNHSVAGGSLANTAIDSTQKPKSVAIP